MEKLKRFPSDTAQFDSAVSFNCNNKVFLLYGIKCDYFTLWEILRNFLMKGRITLLTNFSI